MIRVGIPVLLLLFTFFLSGADFKEIPTDPLPGDRMLEEYFERETRRVTQRSAAYLERIEDWPTAKAELRRQLYEMLGLQPLPARSALKAEVTGTIERDGVIVENLVFQSRPGLYVTANFYRPIEQDEPLPTILYVCGHGRVNIDGVSYGNKTHYQHHGTWFAKNGYTCLTIDTLQLGEIEGHHHGTHRLNRWWWNSRGYTPAGVEAWNSIRALDYLETRDEVDRERIGVTGRSGGGAYTYWVAALDDRIKVAAPVAGITSLENHIVDGCIEGHCDCMFMVNTYRWDFPLLAALIAPRPQLILNTDKDRIFPLDGVVDVYEKTRGLYEALNATDHIGLALYEGPHKDTQPLRIPAFHWFERFLKEAPIEEEIEKATAPKIFEPQELKVLDSIPENERNTFIDDYFTRRFPRSPALPDSKEDWDVEKALLLNRLKSRTFRGWPQGSEDLELSEELRVETEGLVLRKWSFQSQEGVRLPLYLVHRANLTLEELDLTVLNAVDENGWNSFLNTFASSFPKIFPEVEISDPDKESFDAERSMMMNQPWAMAYLPPRGIGPTAWTSDEKERIHIRRRFALLGQTLDSMRIWDLRRGIQALHTMEGMEKPTIWLQGEGIMAANLLYASLFEENIHRLDLHSLPTSHREGPELLNVLRFTDLPVVAAIAAESSFLRIYEAEPEQWSYLTSVSEKLGWPAKQIQLR